MSSKIRPLIILFTAVLAMSFGSTASAKDAETKRRELRAMRDEVLNDFYEHRPELKSRVRDSAGYAVFSNVGVNIIFASFAGGHGVVVRRGTFKDHETFMKMGSAGLGLGLGVKDFRALFIFTQQAKLEDFIAKGWDFGGQADAAAKSDEKGDAVSGSGSMMPGVEAYQLTKNGLVLQATLQGTKYWKDDRLN